MNALPSYIIFAETVSLESEYNELGFEQTIVREGSKTLVVQKSADAIIDDTLTYYFSNRPAAINGAKSIIGTRYHIPIVINGAKILTLIPFLGKSQRIIWVAGQHIRKPEKITSKETSIPTTYGYSITIPLGLLAVEKRIGIAARVHLDALNKIDRRMNQYFNPNEDIYEASETELKVLRRRKKE